MKKFKCTVTITNEYEIELDENVLNDEFMKSYSEYFSNISTLEEVADILAWNRAVHKSDHIEGFGYVLQNGQVPWSIYNQEGKANKAININILSEGDDVEVEVVEKQ